MKTLSTLLLSCLIVRVVVLHGPRALALGSLQTPASFRLLRPVVRCVSGTRQISLTWRQPSNTAPYTILRRSGTNAWKIVGGAQTTQYTDTLPAGKTGRFSYRIQTTNAQSNIMRFGVRSCDTDSARVVAPIAWGSYVGESPNDVALFESKVGRAMNTVALFLAGEDAFPSSFAPIVRDQGKSLVIFWEPHDIPLESIVNGAMDDTLTQFAKDAAAYGGDVIFAPFHEMNGDWDSWGGTVGSNTPQKFIDAWRHVHGLFSNAPNVRFGWVVNHASIPDTPENRFEVYYPGAAYVDITGVDGFNWGTPWQSFDQIFGDALARLRTYEKPMMIFSMGSAEGPQKATWITDALRVQLSRHPDVIGWLWFNANKERDWRIWSDPEALDAFQKSFERLGSER